MKVRQVRGNTFAPGYQVCMMNLHEKLPTSGGPASTTREFSLQEAGQHLDGLDHGQIKTMFAAIMRNPLVRPGSCLLSQHGDGPQARYTITRLPDHSLQPTHGFRNSPEEETNKNERMVLQRHAPGLPDQLHHPAGR